MASLTTPSGQNFRVVDVIGGPSGRVSVPPTLINCYSALSIPAYKRAIAFLADNLASFPRGVRKDGAKLASAHRLDRLLKRRPNGYQSPFVFWRTLFFHAAHTANGYARIDRDTAFRPLALHNMLPEDVCPFRVLDGENIPTQFYLHLPTKAVLPGADVIHLQALSYDGQCGLDPIGLHERTFQRAATLEKYQVQFLRNGSIIRGAIEVPVSMTEEQKADVRAVLQRYRGGEGDEDVLILDDGAKLNNATLTPQESQLVEQTAASTKAISQLTGVPPEFLYELTEAKYNSSVEQAGQNVVRYTFRTWIEMAEDEITLKLLTDAEQEQGLTVHINPDALLRGDTKTQVDTVVATVNGGLRTRNEGREVLGLPRDEGADSDTLKTLGDTSPQPAAAA